MPRRKPQRYLGEDPSGKGDSKGKNPGGCEKANTLCKHKLIVLLQKEVKIYIQPTLSIRRKQEKKIV